MQPLLAASFNTRQRSESPFANILSSSYKLTQLFAQVCAISLLSACGFFYLYKKVPARQTSPIDKMRRLKSQHFAYNPNNVCYTVLTVGCPIGRCTKINYTCIIPQDIDFVKSHRTIYRINVINRFLWLIHIPKNNQMKAPNQNTRSRALLASSS